jgi:hypothetical protein
MQNVWVGVWDFFDCNHNIEYFSRVLCSLFDSEGVAETDERVQVFLEYVYGESFVEIHVFLKNS